MYRHATHKRTKILATLGPASGDEKTLLKLFRAGMDVVRLNMSHGDYKEHLSYLQNLRAAAGRLRREPGVLADLQGPKVRLGRLPDDGVSLLRGRTLDLRPGGAYQADPLELPVPGQKWITDLSRGENILIDDGKIRLVVTEVKGNGVRVRVRTGGKIVSSKGLNFPGRRVPVAAVTRKDKRDLEFAIKRKVDFVALSFVQSAKDIKSLRSTIKKLDGDRPPQIVAKIEKPQALDDIDNIIDVADGIMVARGDLGVELSIEKVPAAQKHILQRCAAAEKWGIVATQMLETMIENETPTRAEVSDVANAIYDGTDCLMLSGETSIGKHPVQAVEMMATVARETEQTLPAFGPPPHPEHDRSADVSHATAHAALVLAYDANAHAIVVFTHSGRTAQVISKMRPGRRIIALSPEIRTLRLLAGTWGVEPFYMPMARDARQMIEDTRKRLLNDTVCRNGCRVVFLAGESLTKGATNMIKVATLE